MYEKYKQWCVKHGQITNAEYVLKFVRWRHKGIALEPSLAPYLLEDGIEHWILWHHPTHTPGSTELDRASEAQLAIQLVARETGLRVDADDVLCFQNIPQLRSIPSIAHSHVFLHVGRMPHASQTTIASMRTAWQQRSPWLQALSDKRSSKHGSRRGRGGERGAHGR